MPTTKMSLITLLLLYLTILLTPTTSASSTYMEPTPPPLTDDEINAPDDVTDVEGRVIEETLGTHDIEQPWVPIITHAITKVDLMFVVDGSGSVNYYKPTNFNRVKSWIKRVASAFDLSTTLMRMGVMQYSHFYPRMSLRRQRFIKTELKLGQCRTKACFDVAVDGIKYMGYTTYTGAALEKVTTYDMAPSSGHDQPLRIIVVLTDGPSSDSVEQVSQQIRDQGFHLIAIGVGNYSQAELRTIATGDVTSDEGTVEIEGFANLPSSAAKVQRMIRNIFSEPTCTPLIAPLMGNLTCTNANSMGSTCTYDCGSDENELIQIVDGNRVVTCIADETLGATWSDVPSICGVCKAAFDMNIVLDSSSSIGDRDFLIMKNFLLRLVDTYKISPNDVQISLMRYNKHVYDLWDYNTYDNKADLLQAIYDIDYNGGGTFTANALEYAYEHKFLEETGIRRREPHITMVITDGKSQDHDKLPWVTESLHKMSHVITIGIIDADQGEINMIASDPDEYYAFNVENSFTELLDITQTLSKTICAVQDFVEDIRCPASQLFNPSVCFDMICDEKFEDPSAEHGIGTSCRARCCPGSQLIGNDTVTCQYDGRWTAPEYECVEFKCSPIQQTVGLDFFCTDDTGTPGAQCEMLCSEGFKIIPPPSTEHCQVSEDGTVQFCTTICILDGESGRPTWSAPPLMCQGKEECDSAPCLNGGDCLNLPGDYYCNCTEGFFGKMCELNFDECHLDPCMNGGTCIDGDNDYTCICKAGYVGKNCEIVIDNCESEPCQYGSFCTNAENDYTCTCAEGFEGKDCDTPKVCKDEFDVLFIMDSSSSMGHANFALVRNFVKAMTTSLAIGKEVQIALFKYTDHVEEMWDYDTHSSPLDMFSAVDTISYEGTGTLTGMALRYAFANYVMSDGGRGRRSHLPHITILLTDGKSQDDVTEAANILKKFSKILVLAVGDGPEAAEIQSIASSPLDLYAKNLKSFDDLADLQLLMGNQLCKVYQDSEETRCPMLVKSNECETVICTDDNVIGSNCTKFCCAGARTFDPISTCQYDGTWSHPLGCIDIDECGSNPCQNEGVCVNEVDSYQCICMPGYSGRNCEIDVDDCVNNFCQNEAMCVDRVNGFDCECRPGFSGLLCEMNDDDCAENLCLNNGKCVDGIDSFICLCPDGFQGDRCERSVCEESTCKHGGKCTADEQGISCACEPLFEGERCEIPVDPCDKDPCVRGTCSLELTAMLKFKCDCPLGYEGMLCETEINECDSSPCQNGATCKESTPGSFRCECDVGYEGALCDEISDLCQPLNPCQNNGVCSPLVNDFACSCGAGWQGKICDEDVDECSGDANDCNDNQECTNTIGSHVCRCKPGYTGIDCQVDIDECASTPCLNDGHCIDKVDGYMCLCKDGFIGDNCETNIDECQFVTCQNGATCQDGINQFTCVCPPGYSGKLCEINDDECDPNPCTNGGICIDGINSFICDCPEGFGGPTCAHITSICKQGNPCQNGGTCEEDGPFGFNCICPPQFKGPTCEEPVGICQLGNPCQNGGTCEEDGPFGFNCICPPQFKGPTCETPVGICESVRPCENGGVCVDVSPLEFSCTCPDGFKGVKCETPKTLCEIKNPCQNGGVCQDDGPFGFICNCQPQYKGATCEEDVGPCELLNPCENGGVCADVGSFEFTCTCTDYYKGSKCEIPKTACEVENPCENGGACEEKRTGMLECTCVEGFKGRRCEQIQTLCEIQNPCKNGGNCVDQPPFGFTCNCTAGYKGDNCEEHKTPCELQNPCENGGVCVDEPTFGFSCNCPEGFKGDTCDQPKTLCEIQNPCQNGGVCEDQTPFGFVCNCAEGFSGKFCDTTICPKDTASEGEVPTSVCDGNGEPGTTCTLSCPDGYMPIQQAEGILARAVVHKRSCLPTGRWSGPEDKMWGCVPSGCPSIDQTPLDTFKDSYDLNVIRSIDLFAGGLVPTTQAPTTTTTTTTVKPFVMPRNTGPQRVTCTNQFNVGSVCTQQCQAGYTLMGDRTRECLLNGKWSGTDGRCERTSCGQSTASQATQQTCTNSDKPGSYCYIQCPPGMSIFGTTYKTCGMDYQWYPQTAWGCAKTSCDKPLPAITNGQIRCTDRNSAKSVCTATCNPGYILLGGSQITCSYRGLDLDWRGSSSFQCLKVPCEKSIDLRTGMTTGFDTSDYAAIIYQPYRSRMDNSYDYFMKSSPCNMKSLIAIKKTSKAARVKVDFWYDYFPSQYHFDVADDVLQRFTYVPDRVVGVGNHLFTNVMMGVSNSSSVEIQSNQVANYFTPSLHNTFYFGENFATFTNNKGLNGKIGPSTFLGDINDEKFTYIGLNRAVNNPYNVGSGVCLVCLNKD